MRKERKTVRKKSRFNKINKDKSREHSVLREPCEFCGKEIEGFGPRGYLEARETRISVCDKCSGLAKSYTLEKVAEIIAGINK